MHRLLLTVIAVCLPAIHLFAQARPVERVKQANPVSRAATIEEKNVAVIVTSGDTIPLGRFKYYKTDKAGIARYLNTAFNKDTVKLEKAGKTDWDEFAAAFASLQKQLRLNQFDNVRNYVDTARDLIELNLLNPQFFPNAAKVCIRQLTFNINLLIQLLAKPLPEKADVQLLGSVMNNIDVLINKYVATKGVSTVIKMVSSPNVTIKVIDTTGAELTKAKCYFISFKTCRDIACRSCIPSLDPCDDNNINSITTKTDNTFDCANPQKILVSYGPYHFFVISNNKIRHYEQLQIDGSTGGNKPIIINLR